jgi:hypothetical protein
MAFASNAVPYRLMLGALASSAAGSTTIKRGVYTLTARHRGEDSLYKRKRALSVPCAERASGKAEKAQ